MMTAQAYDWYFDVVSPFAYLQWQTRARLEHFARLRPVPIVLGALLAHWEQKGPAEIPPKRWHTYRACQFRAAQLGVKFSFPPVHPFNPIAALRLIVALEASEAAVDAVFGAAFGEGRDVSDPAVLAEIGAGLGLADVAAAISAPEVKARLRENTDGAIARGVFGVPSVVVGPEIFWGEDSAALMEAYVADPGMFERPDYARLRALPAVQRGGAG